MLPPNLKSWFEQFKESRFLPSISLFEERLFTQFGKRLVTKLSNDGVENFADYLMKNPCRIGFSYDELFPNEEISKDFAAVLFKELKERNKQWNLELSFDNPNDNKDFNIYLNLK